MEQDRLLTGVIWAESLFVHMVQEAMYGSLGPSLVSKELKLGFD